MFTCNILSHIFTKQILLSFILQFIFELINFDNSTFGLVVIDDMQFTGLLCHEVTVTPSTTINPLQIKQLFSLKHYPNLLIVSKSNFIT